MVHIDPNDYYERADPNPNDGIVSSDVFLTERHGEFAPFTDPEDLAYGAGDMEGVIKIIMRTPMLVTQI